jgi:ferritin-like metal-binding protein YciE
MPLSKEESEDFLNRVVSLLGLEEQGSTPQQWRVLVDELEDLLETRSPDEITDAMIQGAWDVAEHLHPSDGSLRY